jgi:Sulfatase
MIAHDATIGQILKAVDDLGIANDTIVLYTTDNGPHQNSWPDAGTAPFRSEKKRTGFRGAKGDGHFVHLAEPFTKLRVPKIYNLRADPYERADVTSNTYTIG